MEPVLNKRSVGIVMPLFAMRSVADWGVGDFASMKNWINYLASTKTSVLQILPINEMAPQHSCPYNAMTSFAIDPVYICVEEVQDIINSPEAQSFIKTIRPVVDIWQKSERVHYVTIRDAKLKALWNGFGYFLTNEWLKDSDRAKEFKTFLAQHAHWLDNYALFRALKDYFKWQSWTLWPEEFQNADKNALAGFEKDYFKQVLFFKYLQWIAEEQIKQVTSLAASKQMYIFGDIPFGINLDSADVWAERDNFNTAVEVGAPPDQFSTEGQHWGMPGYNWLHMQATGYEYWKRKVGRACELFDIFRLDHFVGFFRTYIYKSQEDRGEFDWLGEDAQAKRGYDFLVAIQEASRGKQSVGEDLGVIPDYVRRIMADLNIPGYKIMRWEQDSGYYRDPAKYPYISIAAVSTHDTETLKGWWESIPLADRADVWEMISGVKTDGIIPFTQEIQEQILRRLMNSGSSIVMLSIQDIVGIADRINTPGTVSNQNWTFRFDAMPENIENIYPAQIQAYKKLITECNR
ncbi:4-Alpha-glucanotransferase [Elusimicrobium minutum Pei191]|uniref:4-alpha-glucanotransferase n=1 Tax=Elusimicrobium minutum (strain Pei191) TaxID=445932 RepID=B2KBC1_ELUMP|nr:4-alpha-glucanotransferase [Elusimicrobium minutum]ACC97943.1 4-Alpha-glucanotransferase [Elusimicrobium minutum Pei191]